MKKICTILLLISFAAFSASAQTSDQKAVKLLKAVSQKYNAYKTMTMDVTLTIENPESKSKEERKGKVLVKGNKFHLELGKQTIISDHKTIWTYLKDANEVQVNNFEQGKDIMSPSDIFKIADKDFYCYLGETVTESGKTLQIVELTPRNKDQNFSKIKMYIDPTDNTVKKGVVYDKSAVHFTYSISNFKSNSDLSDTNFTFDKSKYPGVEVIDLRE